MSGWTEQEVLAALAHLGSLGIPGDSGTDRDCEHIDPIRFEMLRTLRREIRVDHALARRLWAISTCASRVLATLIADLQQADDLLLESWVGDVDSPLLADAFAGYVSSTAFARAKTQAWVGSPNPWTARVGWQLLAQLALRDPTLEPAFFEPYVEIFEREFLSSPPPVRPAMRIALTALGPRREALQARLAAAVHHTAYGDVGFDTLH
jgi:3-methyladenine DNA glycosylase AlkD